MMTPKNNQPMNRINKTILCGLLLCLLGEANAQTSLGGVLKADKTLLKSESPYVLGEDGLQVPEGKNLTIEPGVEVHYEHYSSIVVRGSFNANGDKDGLIKFIKKYNRESISGEAHPMLRIIDTDMDKSSLSYMNFEGRRAVIDNLFLGSMTMLGGIAVEKKGLPELGDLNNDTAFNIFDIVICVESALSLIMNDPYIYYAGDIYQDSIINISDILLIVDLIMSS